MTAATPFFDLTGRLAVVTGGAAGLGYAIAEGLARAGAEVVLTGRRRSRLEAAVAKLSGSGLRSHAVAFDVSDAHQVRAGMATIEQQIGTIDVLVNNAGVINRKPIDAYADDEWHALLATNVDGPFHVTRAVLPSMKARRAGKILNICSLASDLARPNIAAYAVSKGGLKQLTRALAVELAPFNIQVNGIAPGFFATEINEGGIL